MTDDRWKRLVELLLKQQPTYDPHWLMDLRELIDSFVAEDREACAKIVEAGEDPRCDAMAAMIRERGTS